MLFHLLKQNKLWLGITAKFTLDTVSFVGLGGQRVQSLWHLIFFPSGGISIKPSASMDAMRADMGGAATIFSAIVTAAELKLPINLIGK